MCRVVEESKVVDARENNLGTERTSNKGGWELSIRGSGVQQRGLAVDQFMMQGTKASKDGLWAAIKKGAELRDGIFSLGMLCARKQTTPMWGRWVLGPEQPDDKEGFLVTENLGQLGRKRSQGAAAPASRRGRFKYQ